jgi:hypothetical protein
VLQDSLRIAYLSSNMMLDNHQAGLKFSFETGLMAVFIKMYIIIKLRVSGMNYIDINYVTKHIPFIRSCYRFALQFLFFKSDDEIQENNFFILVTLYH